MKKIVKLIDLDCANCAAKIENAIQKIDGDGKSLGQLYDTKDDH